MKLTAQAVDMLLIEGVDGLDPIRVITEDVRPGQGRIIITCWTLAWHGYWGGMGDVPVREFFAKTEAGHLVKNLECDRAHMTLNRLRGHHERYVVRIIKAVQAALRQLHASELDLARQRAAASNAPTLRELLPGIPPPAHRAGLTAAVRDLKVGEHVEVPRAWEKAITSTAKRLGIRLTSRRRGKTDTTTIWREADPTPAAA